MPRIVAYAGVALAGVLLVAFVTRNREPAPEGTILRVQVHGESLERNLAGDPPGRDVSIYLPRSYATTPARRYPVVYLLHGLLDSDQRWFGGDSSFVNVPAIADRAMAAAGREAIIVVPNADTKFGGSMYSSGSTNGDWETFVAQELVEYIDGNYRTVAMPAGRAIAGHSMGGYGALRMAMLRPGVFSAVYAMSPCCMSTSVRAEDDGERALGAAAQSVATFEELERAPFDVRARFAWAAAWSPNPQRPPFFVDLPFQGGAFQPSVASKWAANATLNMVERHVENLQRLNALALDAGDADLAIAQDVRTLDRRLTQLGVAHLSDVYPGDHLSGVAGRIENHVLPLFLDHLAFDADAVRAN